MEKIKEILLSNNSDYGWSGDCYENGGSWDSNLSQCYVIASEPDDWFVEKQFPFDIIPVNDNPTSVLTVEENNGLNIDDYPDINPGYENDVRIITSVIPRGSETISILFDGNSSDDIDAYDPGLNAGEDQELTYIWTLTDLNNFATSKIE